MVILKYTVETEHSMFICMFLTKTTTFPEP